MPVQLINNYSLLTIPLIAGYLADIHCLCFDKSEQWNENAFTELLKNPFHHVCVLYQEQEMEHEIQGFILYSHIVDEVEILTFAVHPFYQGQGLGKKILKEFFQHMQHQHVAHIFLEVNIYNKIACHVYQGCGFVEVGKRLHYYGLDQHALILAHHFEISQNSE